MILSSQETNHQQKLGGWGGVGVPFFLKIVTMFVLGKPTLWISLQKQGFLSLQKYCMLVFLSLLLVLRSLEGEDDIVGSSHHQHK